MNVLCAMIAMTSGTVQVPVRTFTTAPSAAITEPFSSIHGVRELPGGRVIVVDRQERRVVLADFGRGSVTPTGRSGSGPGEYQMPTAILPGPGTDSYLADLFAMKVHVVGADGRIRSSIPRPLETRGLPAPLFFVPSGVDSAGRLYFQQSAAGAANGLRRILRWDPVANRVDLAGDFRSAQVLTSRQQGKGRGVVSDDSPPFTASPAWAVLPDGRVVIVHPAPYRLEVVDGVRRIVGPTREYAPIPVTAAERAAYRKALAPAQAAGNAPPIADRDFPPALPPFLGPGSVLTSPTGEVWVLRTRAATDLTPTYDVFDSTGRLIASATLRPNSRVVGIGTTTLYVARQDPADDLWYLERYRR